MRKIIKQREVIADQWRYAEEGVDAPALIVSLTQWQAERDSLLTSGKQLGVKLAPADKVESIAQDVSRLALIALEFGGIGEGRGYSRAHILRRRHGFTGELRAVGKIQRDQLFYMARCGFDAFELPESADFDAALTAFNDYTVAYQPGIDAGVELGRRVG
ncbi:MAG: DUF934 domain-containing protein [Steroidobacteraceae bacterium]